ncbi:MAG: hypothetical protein M3R08_06770 [Bacteroidota bacterium]|nr:hypothetical protein [Bacteroidota bacterium]
MAFGRHIWAPWLFSTLVMYGLSYVWHGIALTDLQELTVPKTLYFILSFLVYLVIALVLTIGTQKSIQYEWISLKTAFPFYAILIGAAVGFFVYLVIFVMGISFAKHGMVHVLVDVLWQMFEQGMGGLAVSLGIIYDMRQAFLENEQRV